MPARSPPLPTRRIDRDRSGDSALPIERTSSGVRGIGNDMELDEGVGICGKGGQSVPAGVGQPTMLIDGLTVGGTATA